MQKQCCFGSSCVERPYKIINTRSVYIKIWETHRHSYFNTKKTYQGSKVTLGNRALALSTSYSFEN
uniref:Uncharacterized protein n=1 Tax=Nelumbo nucifera TaxID=4432 RepID=A0A822XFP6_NELNU|nr:TPA_asm: hypothetical protein HUJ06_021777 [Nelumbo nucifera]